MTMKGQIRVVTPAMAEQIEVMTMVDAIVDHREGWMVEFVCANPDEGPNQCVGVFGEWGDAWVTRNFLGESRAACLKDALTAILMQGMGSV